MLLAGARTRAGAKRLAFDLNTPESKDALRARLGRATCEVTGLALDFTVGKRKRRWNSVTLDRIVPTHGYVLANVRVCCWAVNAAMNNWGEEIFALVASGFLFQQALRTAGVADADRHE